MKVLLVLPVVFAIGVTGTLGADVAPEKKSTLTISTPLEVPGATLEPGTYVVKLVDTQSNRNVVTFTSVDEKKVFATAIATPHGAASDPRHTTFVFYATADGATKALRTWYAPNDRNGQDFVYAPDRAAALRKMANTDVPALTAEQERELSPAPAPVPAAVVTDAEPVRPVVAPVAPAPMAPKTMAAGDSDSAPATMIADASTLPRTAGRTPLLLVAGFAALALAAAIRFSGRA